MTTPAIPDHSLMSLVVDAASGFKDEDRIYLFVELSELYGGGDVSAKISSWKSMERKYQATFLWLPSCRYKYTNTVDYYPKNISDKHYSTESNHEYIQDSISWHGGPPAVTWEAEAGRRIAPKSSEPRSSLSSWHLSWEGRGRSSSATMPLHPAWVAKPHRL